MVEIINIAWLIASPILLILMVTQYLSLQRLTKMRRQELKHDLDVTFFGYSLVPHQKLRMKSGTSMHSVLKQIIEADDCLKPRGEITRES